MSRELNDSELKNLNGGEGGILTEDTVERLGLTVHDESYSCDSFVMTPREVGTIYASHTCRGCMYGAIILDSDGGDVGNMACLLCK